MLRLKLALIIGGGFLAFIGYQEFVVSQGTSDVAASVELFQLEQSPEIDNKHLEIGSHWAVYPGSIYEYQADRGDTGEPSDSAKVNHTYYPIISPQHPYNVAVAALLAKYEDETQIPDAEWPQFGQFAVLVKTERFGTIGAIPMDWEVEPTVKGLVINKINTLDAEEEAMLRESFPGIDLNRVLVLEEGRQPSSSSKSLGMMAGGGVLSLLGIFLLIPRNRQGPPPVKG